MPRAFLGALPMSVMMGCGRPGIELAIGLADQDFILAGGAGRRAHEGGRGLLFDDDLWSLRFGALRRESGERNDGTCGSHKECAC